MPQPHGMVIGLTKASDMRRINALLDRAKRQKYCLSDLPNFDEL